MATVVLKDRVKETTTTTGTSDFVLAGSSSGYQPFSVIGPNNYTYYCCTDAATGDWEVGYGQYTTTAGGTLVRVSVISNSASSTSKIVFGSGSKDVFLTYPAEKAIYEEDTGETLIDGGPITVVGNGVVSIPALPAELGKFVGNIDSFAQIYTLNQSNTSPASADFVAYNNATTDGYTNFTDMGINCSAYSSLDYPIFTGGSGYVFHDGDDFFIGNQTAGKDLVLFVGGADTTNEAVRFAGADQSATFASDVTVVGTFAGSGGTFTAPVTTSSATTPTNNEFVTKAYVDNATSTGIHIHTPVTAETSAALSAVYTQGGTTFNITDITGTNTVVTSTTHGLSVNDEIWLTTTAGNGLSINTAYFVYSTPTTTSLQLSTSYGGLLLTGLTNASGLSYATRANSGVGAYLEASANAVLPIAGVTTNDRVLVYQQATGYWNGVYTVTSLGSVGSKWRLTRATDANKYQPDNTAGMGAGDYFFVQSNSESYVLTDPVGPIIIGYDSITYTLFSSVPVYTGTSPINITGTTISLTTVPATLGGTGTATVAVGDMLYGSATNTWSKLGIGAQYKPLVVDSAGIPVWGTLALNQSGVVSGALPATNGGTGQTNYAVGDLLYSGATDTLSRLSGNTTTTKLFLGQTGTGSGSAAPVWQQPAATDITGLAASATTDTTNASNISSGTLPSGRLSGSYTGITGVGTLAAGTWNGSTIAAAYGGTGQSSYTVGDLLYASTTTALSKLADVAVGNALISGGVGSAPSWGKIGLATHVSGTLPTANGGTGLTGFTANGVVYASSTSALTTGSALTFDGSRLGVGVASPGFPLDVASISGETLRLRGTTATGVSQVLFTSDTAGTNYAYLGSASGYLAFGMGASSEGMRLTSTGLGIGTSSPTAQLEVSRSSTSGYSTIRLSNSGASGRTYEIGLGGNAASAGYANSLYFYDSTAGALRMSLDSSGNLGLGVTPSAWGSLQSNIKAIQIGTWGGIWRDGNQGWMGMSNNSYWQNSSSPTYISTNAAVWYNQSLSGQHQWYNAPSGTAGTGITFTQAMTLDASGNLGIGTTSPSTRLHAKGSGGTIATFERDASGTIAYFNRNAGSGNAGAIIGADSVAGYFAGGNSTSNMVYLDSVNNLAQFYTNGSERMRIDSSGNVGIGTSSPTGISTWPTLDIRSASGGGLRFGTSGSANAYLYCDTNVVLGAVGASANLTFQTNGSTERMRITSAGGVSFGSSGTAYGTSGQVLTSAGNAPPTWSAVPNITSYGMYEMANTISANYSITSGNNAVSAGPITINTGVTVTVPTGSSWSIV